MTKKRWHSGKMHREELADAYFQTGHRVKEDLHENQRPTILSILPQPRGWDFHEDGCNHSIGFNQPFYPTPDVDLILIGGYRRFGHIEMTIKIGLAPQKYQNRRLLNRHRLSTAVDGFPLDLGIKTLPNCIVVEDKNGGERKGGPKFPSSVQWIAFYFDCFEAELDPPEFSMCRTFWSRGSSALSHIISPENSERWARNRFRFGIEFWLGMQTQWQMRKIQFSVWNWIFVRVNLAEKKRYLGFVSIPFLCFWASVGLTLRRRSLRSRRPRRVGVLVPGLAAQGNAA